MSVRPCGFADFLSSVYRSLPLRYTGYRTVAVHEVSGTTLVVEQEALGVHAQTGARFALPNIAVIDVDAQELVASFRDYANPVAVAEALGEAPADPDQPGASPSVR